MVFGAVLRLSLFGDLTGTSRADTTVRTDSVIPMLLAMPLGDGDSAWSWCPPDRVSCSSPRSWLVTAGRARGSGTFSK